MTSMQPGIVSEEVRKTRRHNKALYSKAHLPSCASEATLECCMVYSWKSLFFCN